MYNSEFHYFSPESYHSMISISRDVCHQACRTFNIDKQDFIYRCFCCGIIMGLSFVHNHANWVPYLYDHIQFHIHRYIRYELGLRKTLNKSTIDLDVVETHISCVEAIFTQHKNRLDSSRIPNPHIRPKTLYKIFEFHLSRNLSIQTDCIRQHSTKDVKKTYRLCQHSIVNRRRLFSSISPASQILFASGNYHRRNKRISNYRFRKIVNKVNSLDTNLTQYNQSITERSLNSTATIDADAMTASPSDLKLNCACIPEKGDEIVQQSIPDATNVPHVGGNSPIDEFTDESIEETSIELPPTFDEEMLFAREERQNAQFRVAERRINLEDVELGSDFADSALRKVLSASEQMRKRQPLDPDFYKMEQSDLHIERSSMRIERLPRHSPNPHSKAPKTHELDPIIWQLSNELLGLSLCSKKRTSPSIVQTSANDNFSNSSPV